jgi:maleylacetoacetate isomerase/maleylpyruvate isomerase
MKLYTYWRSSAAYRVRIALEIKGVVVEQIPIHLVRGGGEQHRPAYRAIHPGATVPALVLDDGTVITQSLAIIGLLDELYPRPALLPQAPVERARVRAAAELVACDIHPINNLRVGQYIKATLGHDQAAVVAWMRHWMRGGLEAFERLIANDGLFCFADQPSLADLCLVPQLYNARRWELDLAGLERLVAIERRCMAMPAFLAALPGAQADAEV